MRERITKYSSIISFVSLVLIAFLMPLTSQPLGILIGIFTLFNLVVGFSDNSFKIYNWPLFLTMILFFAIHLFSITWSQDKPRAWFDIEVKLSLLVFAIAFTVKNIFIRRRIKYILFSFVLGTIISSLYMLYTAFGNYKEIGSVAFYYTNIALFHPSYIAMYFIMSIAIIIRFMVLKNRSVRFITISVITILFLLRMIFLFQSKAGMITIIAVSLFLLIISIIKLRSLLLKVAVTLLVASFSLIMIQKSSRLQAMMESVEKISENGSAGESTTGVRYEIWKIAWDKIKDNWMYGVGAGDIKPTIFEIYKEKDLEVAIRKNLNVHNQYLETFLGQGIIGLSLLLALMFFGLQVAVKRKEWFFSVFILLIGMSFAPESMLNNQSGVIFFAFFYSLFFLQFCNCKEKDVSLNLFSKI